MIDTASPAQKNLEAALDSMEAWTTIGKYDHKKGGGIILWDAKRMIEMPSGSTIVFPAGTKSFSWVGVAPNETRFLVRQFCHAGVVRWVEKGGRSDAKFDEFATEAEIAHWDAHCAKRSEMTNNMFSKVGEIFVL